MIPNEVSIDIIAEHLKLSTNALWHIAENSSSLYKPAKTVRIRGKIRTFDEPIYSFKSLLKSIHKWFMGNHYFHNRAYCGVKGRSYLQHAKEHLGHKYVWKVDVADCFPSIQPVYLKREIRARGFRSDIAELFTLLMTVDNKVPQGSPTSGDALNLVLYGLDCRLKEFVDRHQFVSGRYADDVIASGNSYPIGMTALTLMLTELENVGLSVNPEKQRKNGFQGNGYLQFVHNLVVNDSNGIRISPTKRKEYHAFADSYVASCESATLESLAAIDKKRNRLRSFISNARQIKASHHKHMNARLKHGDRLIINKFSDHCRWPLPQKKK